MAPRIESTAVAPDAVTMAALIVNASNRVAVPSRTESVACQPIPRAAAVPARPAL